MTNLYRKIAVSYLMILLIFTLSIAAQDKSYSKLKNSEIEKQISIAKKEPCADIENRLYLINDRFIFQVRKGNCSDNNYAYLLIAEGLKEVYSKRETIAGPVTRGDQRLKFLFDKLLVGENKENLGLDKTYMVKLIYDKAQAGNLTGKDIL